MKQTKQLKVCKQCSVTKPLIFFYQYPNGYYRSCCRDCHNLNAQKYREKYPNKIKEVNLRKFGISLEEYNKLFEKQQGCCVICNKHQSQLKLSLAVDHNHITGNIRGLLCNRCNTALGLLKEDENSINNMLKYIKR